MGQRDQTVTSYDTPDGVEIRTSWRNEHGTGCDIIVGVPIEGMVEVLIWQIVCNEKPQDPSLSIMVPSCQAEQLLQSIHGGIAIAQHRALLKKCH